MKTFEPLRRGAVRFAAGVFAVLMVGRSMTATASGFSATTCVQAGEEGVTYTVNGESKTKSVCTL